MASLTDIPGIRVGHWTDSRRPTGCTVVLFDSPATAAVDVRGGAPGTRETDLLSPVNLVSQVHAIVLTGGSAFGLAAATGVVRYLEERQIGFDVGVARVPIVPAAVLFDLVVGDASIRPDAESGYQACLAASDGPVSEGSVGAGAGATVGKMLGFHRAMKGGIGAAAIHTADGLCVAALIAANPWGDIRDPRTGHILAGTRGEDGKTLVDPIRLMREGNLLDPFTPASSSNTTIGLVATNAALTKTELTKVAQMAHDGLARTIFPIHTPFDGDTIFAVAVPAYIKGQPFVTHPGRVGILAAEVVADAVIRAVQTAVGLPGIPGAAELEG
ncbi:MAG TPA: P1 family peptidase [Acidobacteriota bacterium]|nr:P1 family peptidase [Acidobacteriota bacterium]